MEGQVETWVLDSIIENIPEMLFVKEAENLTFVRINKAAEDLLGFSREELLGKTDFDMFPATEARFFREKDLEVLGLGKFVEISQEEILTSQGRRYLNTKKIPLKDANGKPLYLVGMSRDITDFVEAQEQLRSLSVQLQRAQENERQRLARELHDELGQVLTGLKIELAWLQNRAQEDQKLLHHVEHAQHLADSALATVRRVASELRPQILDDLGLRSALDWLLEEVCGRAQLQTELEFRLDRCEPNPELCNTFFRVSQEALTNVVRHARARSVKLSLTVNQDSFCLSVVDDGVGLPPNSQWPGSGIGLTGIRERVLVHGGQLRLNRPHDKGGTEVEIKIPIQASKRCHS
jgi:two-component system sensor histidine kinase UhpB